MAITPVDPLVLMLEGRRKAYRGALLTLGRQQVDATRTQVERQAAHLSYALDRAALPDAQQLMDSSFFGALGFAEVSSLDASAYERATFIHDLNDARIPAELEARFDVVLDRGTSEHVFHIPNLLTGLRRMVKPGGRIIHYVASSNHIDHGLYMFSPTLFVDYYLANGFSLPCVWLVAAHWQRARPRVEVFEYQPGCLEKISHGGLDGRGYQVFCVAERPLQDGPEVIPQQSRYTAAWPTPAEPSAAPRERAVRRVLRGALHAVRRSVIGDTLWAGAVNPIKKRVYFRRALPRVIDYQS